MTAAAEESRAARTLRTNIGEFALEEYRLRLAGRTWSVLHTGAVLTHDDEARYLAQEGARAVRRLGCSRSCTRVAGG